MKILEKINQPVDIKKLKKKDLPLLCDELREFIIETVSNNGGHLASSLGAVEITVALHYSFNSPKDKIIWDVGHQSYPHKILTGRKNEFHTIRKFGGLSGFPKSEENEHDQFDTGHSSTSLSVGLGFAKARDIKKKDNHVISVIGDGALTGGMALEALNHLGYLQSRMIIILNDNKMSISENVGALSEYTSRITKTSLYKKIKKQISGIEKNLTSKKKLENLKFELKKAASPNFLFEKLGIEYIGPVDGHSIPALLKAIDSSKGYNSPVIIHVKTLKGKGYPFAEEDSTKFHGISKFNQSNGKKICKNSTYTNVFGEALYRAAKKNKKIVAVTAAMCEGTGLKKFSKSFPERFFDTGIAEQHAVGFCAGLAKRGLTPVFAVYSTFLQRGYDQLIHDIALQQLPVIFAIDRAGIVGEDGPTHHGNFDISYLLHIPGFTILAPSSEEELIQMLHYALKLKSPVAIRYPKEKINQECFDYAKKDFSLDPELVVKGKKVLIIAVGSMVKPSVEAAKKINLKKDIVGVINAKTLKPLSRKMINYAKKFNKIIVVEENSKIGGFGSYLFENLKETKIKFKHIAIKDKFVPHGSREELLQLIGLTAKNIEKQAIKLLKEK